MAKIVIANLYKPLMGDVKAVRSPTSTPFSYPSTSGNKIIKFMIVVLDYVYFIWMVSINFCGGLMLMTRLILKD